MEQIQIGQQSSSLSTLASIFRSGPWLRKNASRFDIFHGLGAYHPTMYAAQKAEQNGLPAVVLVTNHQSEFVDKSGPKSLIALPRQRRRMARQTTALVAMSDAIEEELLEIGVDPKRIVRIPMGVNTDRFHPVSATSRSNLRTGLGWPDRKTIVFSGSLVSRKNPNLLVDAMFKIVESGFDAQLVLMGPESEPQYVEEMRSKSKSLGISDRLIWTGFVENPAPLYQAADLFCLPSQREGMPAALVEGMACGLACVATPISGATDLIDHNKNGRLSAPEPSLLSKHLCAYLGDEELRLKHGRLAREKIQAGFSHTAVLAAYERLFRSILAGTS